MASNNQLVSNNERFTHLLSLYEMLSSQNSENIENLCRNDLFNAFNDNHLLLPQILFHGMHHILYKIDINIIDNMRKSILNINNKKSTVNNKEKKENEDDETIPLKITDIPQDIMSFAICSYLDLYSLLSFEKVSKLCLSRSRGARIQQFELKISKLFSSNMKSNDILRFKNTSNLTIICIYNPNSNQNPQQQQQQSHLFGNMDNNTDDIDALSLRLK